MEKNIWIVNSNKSELIEAQRLINADGGMRAFCMLTYEAVVKAVQCQQSQQTSDRMPSLILMDYDTAEQEEYRTLKYIQEHTAYAGIPLFFMVAAKSKDLDEICYSHGATVALHKPFSTASILRIERTAWQHEMTRNYEKKLQQQASELVAAKEIQRLNQQLESRNALLHQIFGRYFSEEVMDVILDHPDGAAIGGKKCEVTVLMADLRGFTAISDHLQPDAVTHMLNYFLGEMTEVICSFQGTIIEFIGDAILAVFGAPFEIEHAEQAAIAAAITMQNRMQRVNEYNKANGYPCIEMGIGVNWGEVFIGNIGSDKMMRYNVIGQAVNLCSRIESYSVGGQILVSMKTIERLSCRVQFMHSFEIMAKGLLQSVAICELRGIEGEYACTIIDQDEDALQLVAREIPVILHQVEGKSISNRVIKGIILELSHKQAVLQIDTMIDLTAYADVEVSAGTENEGILFDNVYAKVIRQQSNRVTIHFTYVTDEFIAFYKAVRMSETIGNNRKNV